MKKNKPKGLKAVHTYTGTVPVSPEDHQKLIDGPIAAVRKEVEKTRKRIDRIRLRL